MEILGHRGVGWNWVAVAHRAARRGAASGYAYTAPGSREPTVQPGIIAVFSGAQRVFARCTVFLRDDVPADHPVAKQKSKTIARIACRGASAVNAELAARLFRATLVVAGRANICRGVTSCVHCTKHRNPQASVAFR
ncbi:MAG TPA: hypothetical protein VJR91_26795 [Burkholderia sp.]|nr:hypothetical protein [Burkholderia sp.]